MKSLTLALALALAGLVLAGCNETPPSAPETPGPVLEGTLLRFPPNHPQLRQLGVATAAPVRAIPVELPARLVWNEERTQRLYPAFAGRVTRLSADVGQTVKPGTVLARIASPDFGTARADSVKARIDGALTQKVLQRQRELHEAGIIARKELDQAEAEAARSQAEIQRATERTRLYGGGVDDAGQAMTLVAGIPGVVVERNLTPGQELRPEQSGTGVPPLFVVSDPTNLWVMIDARESEVGTLQAGATFELTVPALPGQKFKGRVTAAADFIDPATRSIRVRGVVPNPDRKLKAEMLGTAHVERSMGAGVVVPALAVSLRGTRHFVMVQARPGEFEPREVTLGYQGPREVVVASGLEVGEQVVSENMLLLARQYRMALEAVRPPAGAASAPKAEAAAR